MFSTAPPNGASTSGSDDPQPERSTGTVLVVDDEPDTAVSVGDVILSSLPGVQVLTAISAEEALEYMESHEVDVLISDYRMPGMDGVALLGQAARRFPRTMRILMTAYAELDVAVQAINEARVYTFFVKPFRPEVVVDAVKDAMDRRATLPPASSRPPRTHKKNLARSRRIDR